METLFIAYNDETDSARTNHVRKQLLASGRFLVEGYSPFTSWSKTRNGSSLQDLKAEFDIQLNSASVTLVLIGGDAATNPWIRYAIERSYVGDKALFALDISQIPDEHGATTVPDLNPLERFAVVEDGQKLYLHRRYPSYTWQKNFMDSVDDYIAIAKNSAAESKRMKHSAATHQSSNYRNYESMRLDTPS